MFGREGEPPPPYIAASSPLSSIRVEITHHRTTPTPTGLAERPDSLVYPGEMNGPHRGRRVLAVRGQLKKEWHPCVESRACLGNGETASDGRQMSLGETGATESTYRAGSAGSEALTRPLL